MPVPIHVHGLDGLTLLSPTDPTFDEIATPLLGRVATLALRLKPFVTIVSNVSQQTVVAFSKTWRVTHTSGQTTTFRDHASFPHVVCGDALGSGDPAGLPPGASRIEALHVVMHGWKDQDPYFDQFLPQFFDQNERLMANATNLRIELNGAIFEDGTLVGPDDESSLRETFSAHLEGKQVWYRSIIESLDAGHSIDEAFEPLEWFLNDWTRRLHAGEHPSFGDPRLMSKREAAGDVKRWRRRVSDEELPRLLRESIRLDPFVIRRR
jgi:hypothetical protein